MKKYFFRILCYALAIFVSITTTASADFGLMLGSFKNEENARNYLNDLISDGIGPKEKSILEPVQMQGRGLWYRVCLGPFVNRHIAAENQKLLREKGHDSVIVLLNTSSSGNSKNNSTKADSPKRGNTSLNTQSPPLVPANASINTLKKSPAQKAEQIRKDASFKPHKKSQLTNIPSNETSHPFEATKADVTLLAGDILSIEIPGQEEMSHNYDVDPDGRIYMLSFGEIR